MSAHAVPIKCGTALRLGLRHVDPYRHYRPRWTMHDETWPRETTTAGQEVAAIVANCAEAAAALDRVAELLREAAEVDL